MPNRVAARGVAAGQAACWGGPWLCRVRPSGAVAVVVPSGWQVMFQPQRWITIRWWNLQSRRRLPGWWGRRGPSGSGGARRRPRRWLGAARELAVLVALGDGGAQVGRDGAGGAAESSGWLGVLTGAPSRVPRRQDASPPGPETRSRLQRRMVACSRCRVAGEIPGPVPAGPTAARSGPPASAGVAVPVAWPPPGLAVAGTGVLAVAVAAVLAVVAVAVARWLSPGSGRRGGRLAVPWPSPGLAVAVACCRCRWVWPWLCR